MTLKQFDMGSILMGMEESLIAGTKLSHNIECEQIRKWWNSTAEFCILKCSSVSYNDDLNTVDIVFHSQVKVITLWVHNNAKDYDILTVLPNNVRFVFANPNNANDPIIVTVFGKGDWDDPTIHGTKFNGWKRMQYGNTNVEFPRSNCRMRFV